MRDAGAYGVAAISALWWAADPAAAALAMLGAVDGDDVSDLRHRRERRAERRVPGPATLLDLLAPPRAGRPDRVVELNREIVRRPRLGETPLAEGDAVELVHFVGGG